MSYPIHTNYGQTKNETDYSLNVGSKTTIRDVLNRFACTKIDDEDREGDGKHAIA